MNKMRTVAVFAMVVVVASLCAAKPFRLPSLMQHPPELDEEHPDENYYPESPGYPQIPVRYPRHRPTDSSEEDRLKYLMIDSTKMIDPTKSVKLRPEDYLDADRHRRETDWPELLNFDVLDLEHPKFETLLNRKTK